MSQDKKPVNWLRKQTLNNGVEIAISENSGIVQIALPGMNFRKIQMYADEFFQLAQAFTDIQRYLETHADVAVSRDASRDMRKSKQVQTRAATKAVEALTALGLTKEDLQILIQNKKQQAG